MTRGPFRHPLDWPPEQARSKRRDGGQRVPRGIGVIVPGQASCA